jgi:hypothetical protein
MSLTTAENGDVTLSKARHRVCMEALFEAYAISGLLLGAVVGTDEDARETRLRVRCMAGRLRALAEALIGGLGDEMLALDGFDGLSNMVLLTDDLPTQ